MEPIIILQFTWAYPKSSVQLFLPKGFMHCAFAPCVLGYPSFHCGLGRVEVGQNLNGQKAVIEVGGFLLHFHVESAVGPIILLHYSTNDFFTSN
jgi:hypothetical protein